MQSLQILVFVLATSSAADMTLIPGGVTHFGSSDGMPDERPEFTELVAPFLLDTGPVTVAAYRAYVARSGHRTTAERLGNSSVLDPKTGRWKLVPGAHWRRPLGPDGREARPDHPVTHVSWFDAEAFCHEHGKRLPTELEWEHAARDGRDDRARFVFGEELESAKGYRANVWQGSFPLHNEVQDGFRYTSPVGRFGKSPLGLADMAGNVWEWTASWYRPYAERDQPFEPTQASERAQRGGSYLCEARVCHGYRVSARSHSTPDSSLMHVGFRCAADPRRPA